MKFYHRTHKPSYPPDACRIYGTLSINKVAGNFHVTAGKSLTFPKGHVHFSGLIPHKEYNFTRRINQFSFGTPSPGIIHPLEGDEKVKTQSHLEITQTQSQHIFLQNWKHVHLTPLELHMLKSIVMYLQTSRKKNVSELIRDTVALICH